LAWQGAVEHGRIIARQTNIMNTFIGKVHTIAIWITVASLFFCPRASGVPEHLIVVAKDTSIIVLDLQGKIQEVHEKVGCVGEPLVTEDGIVFAGKFGGLSTIKSQEK